ncbi:MAG TPA: DUF4430 domain-containing protein [Candidatus Thermoplasmatota archaeon]|nr:DUF4430 domain-containing protein [Candidatus Thermoplasmatota archaeon]
MKPALALPALLLAVTLLAGCAKPGASSTLHVDFANQQPPVQSTVAFDPGAHPAAAQRAAHSAPTPAFYTAFDQLTQWSAAAGVPIEVSYSGSFGFFLAKVSGLPASSSDAFWSLSVNGTEAQVGMEQVRVVEGSRISWTLTPLGKPTPASSSPLTLDAPAKVETKEGVAFVNGTTAPGAKLTVRGGPGAPTVQPGGAWSYRIEPGYGRTNLTFTADDGTATKQAAVTVVRLASATFAATYTMAIPPHAASSDLVWYDPDELASKPMYAEKGATHPPKANVHDVMVTWTRQTGVVIDYSYSRSFDFGVEHIDGKGNSLQAGEPPWWCYTLNGQTAGLGISAQEVHPGDVIAWELATCT